MRYDTGALIPTLVRVLPALVLSGALCSGAVTHLYQPGLGTTPGGQPWLLFGQDSILSGGSFSESLVTGGVNLVTDNAISAGYGNYIPVLNTLKNPAFPSLDRAAGFALQFRLRVDAEAHANNNRAGFSIILLANDLLGIELGFWTDRIWAQSGSNFVQAEGAAFNTTAETIYQLIIAGGNYTLLANGNPILSDVLRNYSAFGAPYNLPRFTFLGDDTSSAGANVRLGEVTLLTDIPEPGTLLLFAAGAALLLAARRVQ